jgi:hypothetical protein
MKTDFKQFDLIVEFRYIHQLLQTALEDKEIKNRLIDLLQLNPGERRTILNNWIETYWLQNSGPEIIQALAYLFDDKLASEILRLMTKSNFKSYNDGLIIKNIKRLK